MSLLQIAHKRRGELWQGYHAQVRLDFPIGPVVYGYVAMGPDAEHYKADLNTDSFAMYDQDVTSCRTGIARYPAADISRPAHLLRLRYASAIPRKACKAHCSSCTRRPDRKPNTMNMSRALRQWLANAKVTVTEDAAVKTMFEAARVGG